MQGVGWGWLDLAEGGKPAIEKSNGTTMPYLLRSNHGVGFPRTRSHILLHVPGVRPAVDINRYQPSPPNARSPLYTESQASSIPRATAAPVPLPRPQVPIPTLLPDSCQSRAGRAFPRPWFRSPHQEGAALHEPLSSRVPPWPLSPLLFLLLPALPVSVGVFPISNLFLVTQRLFLQVTISHADTRLNDAGPARPLQLLKLCLYILPLSCLISKGPCGLVPLAPVFRYLVPSPLFRQRVGVTLG